MLIQTVWEGIIIGSVYAMIAMGIALVWGVMGILSFSQEEFMMVGMFIAYYVNSLFGIDPIVAVPITGLVTFGFGCLIYKTIIAKALKLRPLPRTKAQPKSLELIRKSLI